jgi:serine/threonine protein kinase
LGIVCYELVTGWPPFFDKDFDRMCDKILKKPIRFPSKYTITTEAQQFILALLERNTNARLGSHKNGGLTTLQDHIFYLGKYVCWYIVVVVVVYSMYVAYIYYYINITLI